MKKVKSSTLSWRYEKVRENKFLIKMRLFRKQVFGSACQKKPIQVLNDILANIELIDVIGKKIYVYVLIHIHVD